MLRILSDLVEATQAPYLADKKARIRDFLDLGLSSFRQLGIEADDIQRELLRPFFEVPLDSSVFRYVRGHLEDSAGELEAAL